MFNDLTPKVSDSGAGFFSRHRTYFFFSMVVWGMTLATLALTLSCTNKSEPALDPNDPQAQLISRGKRVYQSNCIACHHSDPKKNGSLGPEVHGADQELLAARLLRAAYPEGYSPKRTTKTMPAMPHLEGDIPALTAYLNQ